MASGIPTRRTTRVTRSTAPTLGDENAIMASRAAKSSGLGGKDAAPSKVSTKSSTVASKDSSKSVTVDGKQVLGTRKRAAFGEVTNKGASVASVNLDGASKTDKKPVEKKASTSTLSTTTTSRAPRRTRASTAAEEAAKEEESAAPPAATKRRAPAAASTATSSKPVPTTSRSTTATRKPATSASAATSRSSRPVGVVKREVKALENHNDNYDEVEAAPAKRPRTSSPVKVDPVGEVWPQEQEQIVEGPAKDEGWQDLDAEDEFQTEMVSEYVKEIFIYMQKLEITTLPNPDYMSIQPELKWKMRTILVDWLIEVHQKFRLLPETLFLAVNIVDRFLSARVISLVKLQLVGTTALFVASKYEEVICPSVQNFLYMADGGYGDEEILGAERYLLQTLDFNLSYPNPLHFLRRISKADDYDIQTRTLAKYFMEISCVDHKMLHLKPSVIAAGAAWLARLVLARGEWGPNLVHYSDYSEAELLPAAQLMLNYIRRPMEKQAESLYKKYASWKYKKCSKYTRDWAAARYEGDGERADAVKGHELAYEVDIGVGTDYRRDLDESAE